MTIKVPYVKMNGLGNDFVLIDAADLPKPERELSPNQAYFLADRDKGVGCDQVLELEATPDGSYFYRIWNNDGSRAYQCGNGARCAYAYLEQRGLLKDGKAELYTDAVTIEVVAGATGPRAFLSHPIFDPREIPFDRQQQQHRYRYDLDGQDYEFAALSLGNPHACIWVDDVQNFPLEDLAFSLSRVCDFYEGVNLSLMQRTGDQEIVLRVHERGAGETKACGSAAAAAACVFFQDHQCEAITVKMPGGELKAGWDGKGSAWIEGAVEFEHEGHSALPPADWERSCMF